MAARLPHYVIRALQNISEYTDIQVQCSPKADPLFQDWRYNIICATLAEFHRKGITKEALIQWVKLIGAVYPWSEGYDVFRQVMNRRFVAFPAIIAMTKTLAAVDDAFRIALKYEFPFCIRGGAHAYEPYSTLSSGILIDQSQRTGIHLNTKTKHVTIEPGVLNGPLAYYLGKHGLAIAQGTCANVGVVGLCLGGGMGFLGRKYGLSSDNVISFKILVANGEHLSVDKDTYPDLFWACRGAGNGNFGIITELTLQAHYVPEVIVFELFWPFSQVYQVLTTYFNWLRTCNSVGIEFDIFSLAECSTSRDYPVLITGIYAGRQEKLIKYLQVFLDLDPIRSFTTMTYTESARHFTYKRFPPSYFKNKSYYAYDTLPPTVVPVIEKYMRLAGPNDRIEINGLGAAYDSHDDSAYAHRGALGWIQYIARWGGPDNIPGTKNLTPGWEDFTIGPERIAWVTALYTEVKTVTNTDTPIIRGGYVGCFDSGIKDYLIEYYGRNVLRLQCIKQTWDPKNKFRYPQSL